VLNNDGSFLLYDPGPSVGKQKTVEMCSQQTTSSFCVSEMTGNKQKWPILSLFFIRQGFSVFILRKKLSFEYLRSYRAQQ
jgi:hypothetical protein